MVHVLEYPFIAIISLLNDGKKYEFITLEQQFEITTEILLGQIAIMQQLFPERVRLVPASIQLLAPIALFGLHDFVKFNLTHLLQVEVINTCLSTNTLLLTRIKENKNTQYQVLLANEQLGGRGRQNHRWKSELGNSLTFSVSWQVTIKQDIQAVTLVIAVAIGRALRQLDIPIEIKWPNDLVVGHRKLGGILVESIQYHTKKILVIGVGLNFKLKQKNSIETISLLELHSNIDPVVLVNILLEAIEQALKSYFNNGFKSFQSEFNQWHRDTYEKVRLTFSKDIVLEGEIQAVAENGALVIIDEKQQIHHITTSDFSLVVLD